MLAIGPITIILSVITCCLLAKVFYDRQKNCYKNFPPGPKWLPIIGNINMFTLTEPFTAMKELSKKYGSIFSFHFGMEKIVVVSGYEAVKELYFHQDDFSDRPNLPLITKLTKGHAFGFNNGEDWKVMRKFILPTQHQLFRGCKIIEHINEECDLLVETIKSYGGKPFEYKPVITTSVNNIIMSILIGQHSRGNPKYLKVEKLLQEVTELLTHPVCLIYNAYPSLMRWLPGAHKTLFNKNLEMNKCLNEICTKAMAKLDLKEPTNVLDAFLLKRQQVKSQFGLYYHNENLKGLLVSLFIGGMDTTYNSLRWGLLLMMENPEIQKNVQNEIEKVIGSSQPQTHHQKEMPFTNAVIQEIQRVSSISQSSVPRATTRDIMFRGFFLPKGTFIIPLLPTVLQDKDYFEKPEEFYPQHFLDSEGNFVMNKAYIPFSAGRRSCTGQQLAKLELFLIFTRLMQKFTFHPPPRVDLDFSPKVGFVHSPVPCMLSATPRF
ncbi:cytochrome P450 2K1-like isoform X2 [Mixophyes fleayi]|uniref:cytochrome P450 2K1-like isoform X2 n=1 Tax=Mixophyes fleayi TaxID=3061075 RepID=UPI003F4E3381